MNDSSDPPINPLDDQDPLDAARPYDAPYTAPPSSSPSWLPVALIVAAIVALGGGWYVWQRGRSAPPAQTAVAEAPASSSTAAAPAPVVLPPLEQMDPFLRALLSGLSTNPQLLAWLATDDLVGALATAIDRLAQGQSPARDLAPMRPGTPFATTTRRGVTIIDPASFARYDALATAVASVDPQRLAEAFVTIEPRLNEAYTRQAHPGTVRDAVQRAAATLTATPDTPEEIQLEGKVAGFRYANPQLEALTPAQKHLLRMGPANVAKIREAVRAFAAAVAASQTR